MWEQPYGNAEGSTVVDASGTTVTAEPFTTGANRGVQDHLKYSAFSKKRFPVPMRGSVMVEATMLAHTSGTEPAHTVKGTKGGKPFEQSVSEAQQAAAVLNLVDFKSGQLFDMFVSEHEVFALVERLPTSVTQSPGTPIEKAYTQIARRQAVGPGPHRVGIRYGRDAHRSSVEFFLDGAPFAAVGRVGVPLDRQDAPFEGQWPSLGPGELLSLDSLKIGHGLFSLLDAFPFQSPERPDLAVSIPMKERLFGQGAEGTWSNITVVTDSKPTLRSVFRVFHEPVRHENAIHVAAVSVHAGSLEEATRAGFAQLFSYIQSQGIPMGTPVVTGAQLRPDGGLDKTFMVCFPISAEERMKAPAEAGVSYTTLKLDGMRHVDFGGWATQAKIEESLKDAKPGAVYVAQYNSPFRLFWRHNQVYFT